jgi:outer membrane lipoprotein-sorting protein
MAQRSLLRTQPISLLFAGLLVLLLAAVVWYFALRPQGTPQTRLIDELERELARVNTVQGRLTISLQNVNLEQELWVQRPQRLRTETSAGPSAFAGTIVVLNQEEGWVYSPALNMATVVDRSAYSAEAAGEPGAGSLLERMPDSILAALAGGSPIQRGAPETIAGRQATPLDLTIPPGDASFPAGVLRVWLDDEFSYPLAWQDSSNRALRFSSIAFNQEIDPVTFVFYPPPGAGVQRVEPQP